MDTKHSVVENIDAVMRWGLAVRDESGEKIGSVKEYSNAAAYLVVQTGPVVHKDLYIPYSAITGIDPREVYLNLDRNVLMRQYSAPPQAKTIVEGRTATVVVPGGYDDRPVRFNQVDLDMLRQGLGRGMEIYDTTGDRVGIIAGIDVAAGYLVAKRSRFSTPDFFIPFAAINTIDLKIETAFGMAGQRAVYLAIPKDVLVKEYARLPDGIVLHIDDTETIAGESQETQHGKGSE